MTTGITQSVIATNLNCTSDDSYAGLISLRTTGNSTAIRIPITTLVGRLTGSNIVFYSSSTDGPTYDDYKMRRKAEVLKYRHGNNAPGVDLSTKKSFRNLVKNGNTNSYSSTKLKQIIEENNGNIPEKCLNIDKIWVVSTPSQSGIHDYKISGYYLDPYIPYHQSL